MAVARLSPGIVALGAGEELCGLSVVAAQTAGPLEGGWEWEWGRAARSSSSGQARALRARSRKARWALAASRIPAARLAPVVVRGLGESFDVLGCLTFPHR